MPAGGALKSAGITARGSVGAGGAPKEDPLPLWADVQILIPDAEGAESSLLW